LALLPHPEPTKWVLALAGALRQRLSGGESTWAEAEVTAARPAAAARRLAAATALPDGSEAAVGSWGARTAKPDRPRFAFQHRTKQHCRQPVGLAKEEKHNALNMLAADNIITL